MYQISSNDIEYDFLEDVGVEDKSVYANSLPQINTSGTRDVKPTVHLYEKDVGHKSIKKVCKYVKIAM